jgi:hypothetical protein
MIPLASHSSASSTESVGSRLALALSVCLHLLVLAALIFWFKQTISTQFVAAGPGEGGEGGGGPIEVGVADPSDILGFARPQTVSFIGDEDSLVNNARVESSRLVQSDADALLPPTEREKPSPDSIKTDRPVATQHERPFTGKEERGRGASSSAQVGRSFGSPAPAMAGGIGIGSGGGFGGGTGLPGGSAYGRLIQSILSRNYSPPAVAAQGPEYVIILVRIARDGRILSVANGRVSAAYFKRRSPLALVNNAAERAVLAANPLPPFPAGFLGGSQEAVAEVWFRYPK